MAYFTKVGSFNIDITKTAGQTQSVTGLGFQPKIVFFWWSGSEETSDSVGSKDIYPGFGAATSSSNRFFSTGCSLDNLGTSSAYRIGDMTACIYRETIGTDEAADFSSMDTNGFTIIIDTQFTIALRVSYLALGGSDLTNVYIGGTTTPTGTGDFPVTSVGFKPDAIILSAPSQTSEIEATFFQLILGMATSSSNQGNIYGQSDDSQATSNTSGYGYNGECFSSGGLLRASFVSFDNDGFTLNFLAATTARYMYYACLKGGQYSVGDITTRTDGNDISEVVGFSPVAILFGSSNRALSTQGARTDHNRMSIGAATSTNNREVQAISDEDALDTTEVACANYSSAVYAYVKDDTTIGLMDIKSIDSTGFTAVMDDADPSPCWVMYLAIGATEVYTEIAYGENNTTQGETEVSWATWSNGAGGTPTIIGDADWGKLELAVGQEGRSAVLDIGNSYERIYKLTENRYGTGQETATLQIRGDTSSFLQDAGEPPNWETYSTPITRTWRYVQVREIKSS